LYERFRCRDPSAKSRKLRADFLIDKSIGFDL
jgi:hypothetical protein